MSNLQGHCAMSRVTVLMPVFNAELYVKRAIQSILQQTYNNLQLLILDDGSTDTTQDIISSLKDQRICYVRNKSNIGLARTLNKGLAMIDSEYIVRMDADDYCHRRRLEWQVNFMDTRKEIGVSGTWLKTFGDWKTRGCSKYMAHPEDLKICTLFRTPVAHATVIIRNSLRRDDALCYDPRFNRTEDYDLWERIISTVSFGNISKVAYYYRRHPGSSTISHPTEMVEQYRKIVTRQLKRIGITAQEDQIILHEKIGLKKHAESLDELQSAEVWLKNVKHHALSVGYHLPNLDDVLSRFWFQFCRNSALLGREAARLCYNSELFFANSISHQERLLFTIALHYHSGKRKVLTC